MLFEDALELIHETIGCVGVACKPTLGYKLLTANQKSATINLRTENDWSGLITDVMAKAKTKTDVSVLVSVFPDNVSAPTWKTAHQFSTRTFRKIPKDNKTRL
jgi:hypothetical protein